MRTRSRIKERLIRVTVRRRVINKIKKKCREFRHISFAVSYQVQKAPIRHVSTLVIVRFQFVRELFHTEIICNIGKFRFQRIVQVQSNLHGNPSVSFQSGEFGCFHITVPTKAFINTRVKKEKKTKVDSYRHVTGLNKKKVLSKQFFKCFIITFPPATGCRTKSYHY